MCKCIHEYSVIRMILVPMHLMHVCTYMNVHVQMGELAFDDVSVCMYVHIEADISISS
jgi:hypothetical protein